MVKLTANSDTDGDTGADAHAKVAEQEPKDHADHHANSNTNAHLVVFSCGCFDPLLSPSKGSPEHHISTCGDRSIGPKSLIAVKETERTKTSANKAKNREEGPLRTGVLNRPQQHKTIACRVLKTHGYRQ